MSCVIMNLVQPGEMFNYQSKPHVSWSTGSPSFSMVAVVLSCHC